MCGRYSLTKEGEEVARLFELLQPPPLAPRYNIAPSQPVVAVLHDADRDVRHWRHMHWGLVPHWSKDPAIGQRLINARSETAAQKPSFRSAMRYRRCLLPADGFYEWQRTGGPRRRPHHVTPADGGLFALAGLWEHWQGPNGEEIDSCAILTTVPNELMRPLHDRMPVIVPAADHRRWLDPGCQDAAAVAPLLAPLPAELMVVRPVGTYVNNPRNDGPRCIDPEPERDLLESG